MDEKLTAPTQTIYVCDADLKEGEMRGIKVEYDSAADPSGATKRSQWILIVHYQKKYYALDAACAHSGYPLFKGTLDKDGVITCGLHYAKFQCQTGKVVSDPPICEHEPTFQIEVKEGKIYWLKKENA